MTWTRAGAPPSIATQHAVILAGSTASAPLRSLGTGLRPAVDPGSGSTATPGNYRRISPLTSPHPQVTRVRKGVRPRMAT